MEIEQIKESLCYYDERNPLFIVEKQFKDKNCYCDNCFRGKTQLAEELLKAKIIIDKIQFELKQIEGMTSFERTISNIITQ